MSALGPDDISFSCLSEDLQYSSVVQGTIPSGTFVGTGECLSSGDNEAAAEVSSCG